MTKKNSGFNRFFENRLSLGYPNEKSTNPPGGELPALPSDSFQRESARADAGK